MTTRQRVFRWYVLGGAAGIAVYFHLPAFAQNLGFVASNLVALVAILGAIWRRRLRPTTGWLLLAAFPAATAVGNIIYFVNDSLLDVAPFPSVGDAFFLGGYVLLAAGLLRLQQSRSSGRDLPAVLDTAIITIGFAAASWVWFLAPLVHDPGLSLVERLTALGYPVADVLVLAVTARYFFSPRPWGAPLGWLMGTAVLMLVADTVFAVLNLLGAYSTGNPVDVLILGYNLGWGAVALHPRAAELAGPVPSAGRPGWWRLAALTVASLVAPAVLVVLVLTGHFDDLLVVSLAAATLFVLVTFRMSGLLHDLQRSLVQRGELEAELEHRALHDELTGLPNRALILDRVEHEIVRARRENTPVAVLFLDVDHFKEVNDTFGHNTGDELLRAVATRLTRAVRGADTVGRFGGDEFVVLLEGDSLDGGPERVAERVLDVLAAPYELPLHERKLSAHASIGIAVGDRERGEDLLRDADLALYEAKRGGRNRYALFEPAMHAATRDRLELEMDLREALPRRQLTLHYQPTVDLRTGEVNGVEALLRWEHPTRGQLQPHDFLPIAENSGLIVPIGRWVLAEACRQAAAWRARGHALGVSVNVSFRQLSTDADLLDDVRTALDDSGLDPDALTLELAENVLMRDVGSSARRLRALKTLGVRIAVDDFGTGYSSLAYLEQLPVDTLKIDESFVARIGRSAESATLIHVLVELGKTVGLETLAEGIEEAAQLTRLRQEHCDAGQGFLFAGPLPARELERLLQAPVIRGWAPAPRAPTT